jgi:hypothetical protein
LDGPSASWQMPGIDGKGCCVRAKEERDGEKQKTGSRDESFADVLTLPRLWVYVVLQTMKLEGQRRQMVLPRQLR